MASKTREPHLQVKVENQAQDKRKRNKHKYLSPVTVLQQMQQHSLTSLDMDNKEEINKVQHDVLSWRNKTQTLTNIYKELNPDIILMNSHGLKPKENIKIYNYNTYLINFSEEMHSGSATLVRQNLKRKIKDNYDTDII